LTGTIATLLQDFQHRGAILYWRSEAVSKADNIFSKGGLVPPFNFLVTVQHFNKKFVLTYMQPKYFYD
jgi:hypothetical protein